MDEVDSKKILLEIKKSFESHSSNVKEEVRLEMDRILADVRNWYVDLNNKIDKTNERIAMLEKNTAPAVSVFNDAAAARRVLVWTVGGLAAFGGLILMFREIFFGK